MNNAADVSSRLSDLCSLHGEHNKATRVELAALRKMAKDAWEQTKSFDYAKLLTEIAMQPYPSVWARFEERNSLGSTAAQFYLSDRLDVVLPDVLLRTPYPSELEFSASEQHIACVIAQHLELEDCFAALPALVMFNSQLQWQQFRERLLASLRWSAQQSNGLGFAVPETHFDGFGTGEKLGRGSGVSQQQSITISQRLKKLFEANGSEPVDSYQWFLLFAAATSSSGRADELRYGAHSASDDLVFRLLPLLLDFSQRSVQAVQRLRARRGKGLLPVSRWSPKDVLRVICNRQQMAYFTPMFTIVYGDELLDCQFEVLAHPSVNIRIPASSEVAQETVASDSVSRFLLWPILSCPPAFLTFHSQSQKAGLPTSLLHNLFKLYKDKSENARLACAQLDAYEKERTQKNRKPISISPFDLFCGAIIREPVLRNSLIQHFQIDSECHYAFILPSQSCMQTLRGTLAQRGGFRVLDGTLTPEVIVVEVSSHAFDNCGLFVVRCVC